MNFRLLNGMLILTIGLLNIISAQEYPDKKIHAMLKSGIDLIIEQNYSAAEKEFNKLKNEHPEIPLGDIYLAGVSIAKSIDFGEEFDDKLITEKLDLAEKQSEILLEKDEENIWNDYFMALTRGYLAYYQALKNSYISAFSNGFSSIKYFEKCKAKDSTFFEANIAIGTYQYWKSEKTEFLEWLPFLSDERDLGIKNLEIAIKYPSYNHYLAISSLIWIHINKKEYRKAAELAEVVLRKYPNSRYFRMCQAQAFKEFDKKKAVEIYNEILSSVLRIPNNNHYNEIILKHKIAMLLEELGENKKALKLCNEILSITITDSFVADQISERLERVKKLQKELSEG